LPIAAMIRSKEVMQILSVAWFQISKMMNIRS